MFFPAQLVAVIENLNPVQEASTRGNPALLTGKPLTFDNNLLGSRNLTLAVEYARPRRSSHEPVSLRRVSEA